MKVTFLVFIIVTVVAQTYSTAPQHQVYVILGNSALVKCEIPSFVADFVSVVSWVDNEGNEFFPSNNGTEKSLSLVLIGTHKLLKTYIKTQF